jgi:hypothetical protein
LLWAIEFGPFRAEEIQIEREEYEVVNAFKWSAKSAEYGVEKA